MGHGPIRAREVSHIQVTGVIPRRCTLISHNDAVPPNPTANGPAASAGGMRACRPWNLSGQTPPFYPPPQPIYLFWWMNGARMRHTVAHALKHGQCEANLLTRRTVS